MQYDSNEEKRELKFPRDPRLFFSVEINDNNRL